MSNSLIIDIGNTTTKIALFRNGSIVEDVVCDKVDDVIKYIREHTADRAIVSSVANIHERLNQELLQKKVVYLSSHTPLPIKNNYKTPNTLGVDRIAAVVGAYSLFPRKNCLVIDMGTCITYDFIDDEGSYWGGSISPGLNMRYKAMHEFTANLPLVDYNESSSLTGNTTITAIQSGVINGLAAEIDGIISQYKEQKGNINVLLCGGDANSFESKIKAHIFAPPKLVLIGLNRILEYNENN